MLKVENLSKVYYKNRHYAETFREEIVSGIKSVIGRGGNRRGEPFYALKDISFELKKGEVLGVVGRNGSGKSTLLRILSRITAPTSGKITVEGKSSSILNIGTGFHPDLSGRENIFLNGELLGQSRKEIKENFDRIVELSGIEEFLDTQVKHYSNGMFLRLAFAIAFHSPAELLFLDEVLSVGDAEFQVKSLNNIEKMAAEGTSIIMVTHNLNEVTHLCHRTLWLDKGEMRALGPTMEVLEQYIEETYARFDGFRAGQVYFKEGHYQLNAVRIHARGKEPAQPIYAKDSIVIELLVDKLQNERSLEISMQVYDMVGIRLMMDSYGLRQEYQPTEMPEGEYRISCEIPGRLLNRGHYRLNFTMTENNVQLVDTLFNVALFQVEVNPDEDERIWNPNINSSLRPHLKWEVERIEK